MKARRKNPLSSPPKSRSVRVRKRMQANLSKRTGPENVLFGALRAAGIREIRRNYNKLPGTPDVAFPRRKLAVFVHGCFWHQCPRCKRTAPRSNRRFWLAKFALNERRDARVKRQLRTMGWRTTTVWECGINRRLPAQVLRIKRRLLKPRRLSAWSAHP